jgi:hypothetical protein
VNAIRLLVERDGTLYKMVRLDWSNSDVSLYITPYVPEGGTGYAGQMKVPAPGDAATWDYARQASGVPVKVSLHESGRSHSSAGGEHSQPTWGRPLFHPEQAHIATVSCFNVEGLPTVSVPRSLPQPDIVMRGSEHPWTAVHVPIFVCPDEEAASTHRFWITMTRPGRARPLLVGIGGRSTFEPEGNRDGGVLVYAGWGPGNDPRPLVGVYGVTSPPQEAPGRSWRSPPG